jgi:hypothetical protein
LVSSRSIIAYEFKFRHSDRQDVKGNIYGFAILSIHEA